jgi:catechol 2,3-dioxygenase-like lactoylglutathione lyase family enzyme
MKRLICLVLLTLSTAVAQAQPMKMEAPPWPATEPKLTGAMAWRTTIVVRDVEESLKLYRDILGMQLSESIRNVANPVLEWTIGFAPGEAMDFEVLRPSINSPDVNANSSYLALIAPHIKKPDAPAVPTEGRSPYGSMGLFILTPDADAAFNKVKAAAKERGYVIVKEGARDDKGRMTRFWMRDADGAKLMIVQSNPMPLFLKKVEPSIIRR